MRSEHSESEFEAAAALAAIEQYLASEQMPVTAGDAPPRSRWHESSMLARLGMRPQRLPVVPRWATIERLKRAR
jgi:hypothetical protein